jgi:phospholipase C
MSDAAAAAPAVAGLSPKNPFPGLRPYEEQDATWFFGRGREINELLKRLRRVRFLSIVGPSGCGKSSLVKAGLLLGVRGGYLDAQWQTAAFRPGERPMDNLAAAIAFSRVSSASDIRKTLDSGPMGLASSINSQKLPPGTNVLILVDQFEELFQFVQRKGEEAEEEAKAFLKLLLTAAASDNPAVYVTVTMRLEWLAECAAYPGLAEAMNEGLYIVPQMTRRQFQQAILGPVEAAKGSITSGLLDRLLNDIDGRTDQLPVLQHALMRMWPQRVEGKPLDSALYDAVGTFSNSLSGHAEEIFSSLNPEEQKAAEWLFRSITQVFKNRRVRRPRPLGEIADSTPARFDDLKRVVKAFAKEGRSFLVTTPGELTEASVIDISHEAIIRQWNRLEKWVADEADTLSRIAHLEEDVGDWERGERKNRAVLYRGSVLARAEQLRPRLKHPSGALDFLHASRRADRVRRILGRDLPALALVAFLVWAGVLVKKKRDADIEARLRTQKLQSEIQAAETKQEYSQSLQNLVYGPAVGTKPRATAPGEIALTYAKAQLPIANNLVKPLRQLGYKVRKSPAESLSSEQTLVGYFHDEDSVAAEKVAALLRVTLAGPVVVVKEGSSSGSPTNLEIKLSSAAEQIAQTRVKHLVVLMMESRSFDFMLGFLKSPGYAIDGLTGTETNPDTTGASVSVSPTAAFQGQLDPDPPHAFPDVNVQIFGNAQGQVNGPLMQGFVKSYYAAKNDVSHSHVIMKAMIPSKLPVLTTLARNFAVSDRWFSSVPGSSIPNYFFVLSATSGGSLTPLASNDTTVFELLDKFGITSKLYYSDSTLAFAFRKLFTTPQHLATYNQFLEDCRTGNLPAYSFVEPRHADADDPHGGELLASDQHPDHNVQAGEQLIAAVYNAVRNNPSVWESTILVITYSQHGGLYDHVAPPATVSPDGKLAVAGPNIPPFDFKRLGVRVPAVIISPYIEARTIDHMVYDHTSVIATARKLFLGNAAQTNFLTQRDRNANTFEHLLTRKTPRTDAFRFDLQ